MNGNREKNRLTTIKRHNIFVVGVSVIIGAAFWIGPLVTERETLFSYKTFKTAGGWGYDILVNDTLRVHQDCMPAVAVKKAFPKEEQARQAALLVIKKLKAGKLPAISRAELELICPPNE